MLSKRSPLIDVWNHSLGPTPFTSGAEPGVFNLLVLQFDLIRSAPVSTNVEFKFARYFALLKWEPVRSIQLIQDRRSFRFGPGDTSLIDKNTNGSRRPDDTPHPRLPAMR